MRTFCNEGRTVAADMSRLPMTRDSDRRHVPHKLARGEVSSWERLLRSKQSARERQRRVSTPKSGGTPLLGSPAGLSTDGPTDSLLLGGSP